MNFSDTSSHVVKIFKGSQTNTGDRELAVYQFLQHFDNGVSRFLPEYVDSNASGIFATKMIPDAETLRSQAVQAGWVLPDIGRQLGSAVGLLHSQPDFDRGWIGEKILPSWNTWFRVPVHVMLGMNSATIEFVKLVQQTPGFNAQLEALSNLTESNSFIHNDLKWDNILAGPDDRDEMIVTIIDWEMAGVGDPCWDVGTVLSEFITFWSQSIPVVGGESYEDYAKYPIEEMQPAIRAFWRSYATAMAFDAATARERLLKSVRFAGARLIQTAYERTQTMTSLTPHSYMLLQLSLNVMEQPEDAAEYLLGIPVNDFQSS